MSPYRYDLDGLERNAVLDRKGLDDEPLGLLWAHGHFTKLDPRLIPTFDFS